MSTISASTTSTTAYKVTADTTGALVLQTGATPTTAVTIDTSQNTTLAGTLTIGTATQAVPSGNAPLYAARAWVNFNGTGTVAIRGSGNVTSITDNGTGDYTINFTTAMPDTNYGITAYSRSDSALTAYSYLITSNSADTKTTSALRISSRFTSSGSGSGVYDSSEVGIAIFR